MRKLDKSTLEFMQKTSIPFDKLYHKYLLDLELEGVKPSSLKLYEDEYKSIERTLEALNKEAVQDISKIDKDLGRSFLKAREGKNKVTYINRLLKRAQTLFNFAQEEGYLESNPWRTLKAVKDNSEPITEIPTMKDLKKLLHVCKVNSSTVTTMKCYLATLIMSLTSTRVSQVLQITYDMVDRKHMLINTPASINKTNLPMTLAVNEEVIQLIDIIKENYSYGSEYIFSNSGKGVIDRHVMDNYLKKMCAKGGMSKINCHLIRKIVITNATKVIGVENASLLAGHKKIITTYNNYVFPDKKEAQEQAKKFVSMYYRNRPSE